MKPGTFNSHVRLDDDVMSDCVGGSYIIVKNRKKSRKWWATLRKRDVSTNIVKALRGFFEMSSMHELSFEHESFLKWFNVYLKTTPGLTL